MEVEMTRWVSRGTQLLVARLHWPRGRWKMAFYGSRCSRCCKHQEARLSIMRSKTRDAPTAGRSVRDYQRAVFADGAGRCGAVGSGKEKVGLMNQDVYLRCSMKYQVVWYSLSSNATVHKAAASAALHRLRLSISSCTIIRP